ncbi:hypothetical protein PROFUN_03842 [Planoprotostelium fungivorum]|uniref:Uncharacterized protein n=1 Tax=Planoprotostelium fungivorum TaxID=1890364 RepID=A0A2P6NIC1_9EUKA|nr:hypothetical protein PROFUN_03842 [Planoprotostelium fungivorum]
MSDDSMQVSGAPSLLYTTIIITGATAVVFFILAVLLRKKFPRYFMRKIFTTNQGRDIFRPDYDKSKGWFNWIMYVLRYNEEAYMLPNHAGLETVLYLKFLKYAAFLFAALTLMNSPLLMGIYTLGSVSPPLPFPITHVFQNSKLAPDISGYVMGLDVVTMSNLQAKSNVLAAPLILTIFTTFAVWFFMYKYASLSSLLAIRDSQKHRTRRSTALIKDVSVHLRSEEKLLPAMERIHSAGSIGALVMVPSAAKLRELQEEYSVVSNNLQIAIDYNAEKKEGEERLTHKESLCGPKMDSEEFHTIKKQELLRKIDAAREGVRENEKKVTPLAFAVFRRAPAAVMASQTIHRHRWSLSVTMAPDADSIIWKNVNRGAHVRTVGAIASIGLIIALFLFWPVPVAFLSGIMNLATLSKIPGFDFLVKLLATSSWLTGIIQGILPTLALRLFMFFLVLILRSIHSLAFPISELYLDHQVMRSYWSFVLFNVFFVCVISGALYKSIGTLLESPMNIPSLLASAVPGVTTFFINYILVNISGHYLFLSRAVELAVSKILARLLSKTKAEKKKREDPGAFDFVTKIGDEILVFSIGLIYSVLGPLVNPFAAMFFFSAYFTTKHHMMYSYSLAYEGFNHSPVTMEMVFASLVIYQILMVALFLMKSFIAGVAVIPFIAMGAFFYLYLRTRYLGIISQPPLDYLICEPLSDKEVEEARRMYTDPAMGEPDDYSTPVELVHSDSQPVESDGLTEMSEIISPPHMPPSPIPSAN